MHHWTALITLISFFMWIQPLGAFIAPAQEGTACGGLRAYHMCSMQWGKGADRIKNSKVSFTSASLDQHAKDPGSSSGNHLSFGGNVPTDTGADRIPMEAATFVSLERLFLSGIDPIPKA